MRRKVAFGSLEGMRWLLILALVSNQFLFAFGSLDRKSHICASIFKSNITIGMQEQTNRSYGVFREFTRDILEQIGVNIADAQIGVRNISTNSLKANHRKLKQLAQRSYGVERSFLSSDPFLNEAESYGTVIRGRENIIKYFDKIFRLKSEIDNKLSPLSLGEKLEVLGNLFFAFGSASVTALLTQSNRPLPLLIVAGLVMIPFGAIGISNLKLYATAFDSKIMKELTEMKDIVLEDRNIDWAYSSQNYSRIKNDLIHFTNTAAEDFSLVKAHNYEVENPYVNSIMIDSELPQEHFKKGAYVLIDHLLRKVNGEYELAFFLRTTSKKPKKPRRVENKDEQIVINGQLIPIKVRGN